MSRPLQSIAKGNPWLAGNLTAQMAQRGVSNARLARWIPGERQAHISREVIGQWRRGTTFPTDDHLAAVCIALQCTLDDLLKPPSTTPVEMLSLPAWARREGIPVTRARDLFALHLLSGERITPYAILVPTTLTAPKDSKILVLMAKRRPRWVPMFQANFPRLVREINLDCATLGEQVGVNSQAVNHWMTGRNYPDQRRLPLIAEALQVPMQALIGDMRL